MDKRVILLLLLLVHVTNSFGQDMWKLNVVKNGIKIYTRPVANSKVKAIKVECTLAARPSQLVAVIMDINASEQWVYHSKTAKILKQPSPAELYYYAEVAVPWPAQNRDYVSHISVSQNAKTKVVTVDAPCIPGMAAIKSHVVRISQSVGKWTINPVVNNHINVVYELNVDPSGSIPAWLVNLFATQGPLETFEKLTAQLQKPLYKDAKLNFIKD